MRVGLQGPLFRGVLQIRLLRGHSARPCRLLTHGEVRATLTHLFGPRRSIHPATEHHFERVGLETNGARTESRIQQRLTLHKLRRGL